MMLIIPALPHNSVNRQARLKNAKRVALLGIGSTLRADDAAGTLIAQQAGRNLKNSRVPPTKSAVPFSTSANTSPKHSRPTKMGEITAFKVFFGETAPENVTGEIRSFKPSHIIMIDSADFGAKPGTIRLIEPGEIGGFSFSTHALPLRMLAEYLIESLKCKIIVIGIQPKALKFGEKMSAEVRKAVKLVSSAIIEVL